MKKLITLCTLSLFFVGCAAETDVQQPTPIKTEPTNLAKKDLQKNLKKTAQKAPVIAGKSCSLFGNANDVVKCPIRVTGNTGAVAMQMEAIFDASKMQFNNVSCTGSDNCEKLSSGHDVRSNDMTTGSEGLVKLIAFSITSLDPMAINGGSLFELNFKLKESIAEADAQTIALSNLVFSSDKGTAMPIQFQNGVIAVQ